MKKEVQKRSSNLNLTIFSLIKAGKSPKYICLELGFSQSRLSYYLSSLKYSGFIRKVGYGTWEILKEFNEKEVQKNATSNFNSHTSFQPNKVRSHAFMFTLKIPNIKNWSNREEYLKKKEIPYKFLNNLGGGQQIAINHKKVHLKNNSILIYDKESYICNLAREGRSTAIYNFIKVLKKVEITLNISLEINKQYKFKVSREHHSLIKNSLARQYDEEGKKLHVYNENGLWMLIDNSFNLHELEAVKVEEAVTDNEGTQALFNSHKNTEWKVTPDWILEAFNKQSIIMHGIQQNQLIFDANMKSHLEVLNKIGTAIEELRKVIKKD